jgi:hypothetical protein
MVFRERGGAFGPGSSGRRYVVRSGRDRCPCRRRCYAASASLLSRSEPEDWPGVVRVSRIRTSTSTPNAEGEALVYIDPPYVHWGYKLYRYHDREKDHRALARFTDAARFKRMFRGQKIVPIFLNHAVKRPRKAEELLISNIPLNLPVYRDAEGSELEPV